MLNVTYHSLLDTANSRIQRNIEVILSFIILEPRLGVKFNNSPLGFYNPLSYHYSSALVASQ